MMRRVVRTIRMINRAIGNSLRLTRDIFDDWLTRAAAMICVVIIAVVIFNMNSDIAEEFPLLGTLIFALVPLSFIAGGIIFVVAILKFSGRGSNDEAS